MKAFVGVITVARFEAEVAVYLWALVRLVTL
jgi:hypothetical protein